MLTVTKSTVQDQCYNVRRNGSSQPVARIYKAASGEWVFDVGGNRYPFAAFLLARNAAFKWDRALADATPATIEPTKKAQPVKPYVAKPVVIKGRRAGKDRFLRPLRYGITAALAIMAVVL